MRAINRPRFRLSAPVSPLLFDRKNKEETKQMSNRQLKIIVCIVLICSYMVACYANASSDYTEPSIKEIEANNYNTIVITSSKYAIGQITVDTNSIVTIANVRDEIVSRTNQLILEGWGLIPALSEVCSKPISIIENSRNRVKLYNVQLTLAGGPLGFTSDWRPYTGVTMDAGNMGLKYGQVVDWEHSIIGEKAV